MEVIEKDYLMFTDPALVPVASVASKTLGEHKRANLIIVVVFGDDNVYFEYCFREAEICHTNGAACTLLTTRLVNVS